MHLTKTDFAFAKKTTIHFRFRVKFYNFAHKIQQKKNMDIKEIINKRYAMPDASLHKLQRCLTEVSYPKGFQVLKRGKVEKNIFFIKKGIVRAYTPVDGKQITFWFGKEGATIVSLKGYVNDEPGYETMELMEDSILYVLSRKNYRIYFCRTYILLIGDGDMPRWNCLLPKKG